MKFIKLIVVASCIGLSSIALAQKIQPDTLEDLKAEFEYQQKQAEPYLSEVDKASKAYMECINSIFDKPLTTNCDSSKRNVQRIKGIALGPLETLVAAKEAYEREQRKADRKNSVNNGKP